MRNEMGLFDKPPVMEIPEGSLNLDIEIRHLISKALKQSPKSRYEIAGRMSELLGAEVSKFSLDNWTAESKENWRFPVSFLIALEVALDSNFLLEFLCSKKGCKLLSGDDLREHELFLLEREKENLDKKIKLIKKGLSKGL